MKATSRNLLGRTIAAVDFNVFATGVGKQKSTDPVITLDNGARLRFRVAETEVGEYGIEILILKKQQVSR